LAIQEARKIGKEKRIIDTQNWKGIILWSGHENIHPNKKLSLVIQPQQCTIKFV
jgi:hypothetical protein